MHVCFYKVVCNVNFTSAQMSTQGIPLPQLLWHQMGAQQALLHFLG